MTEKWEVTRCDVGFRCRYLSERPNFLNPARPSWRWAIGSWRLFHVSGTFWALDDVCTHDGGTLADGQLDGHSIACARHGAKFDIRDGRALTMPATQPTSPMK
jgi:phenylpropionate dioxygenase-like ring-hydroxylating dioxygenase large terminal subunit